MKESNELRIGNLLSTISDEPETVKVEGIKSYDLESDVDMVRTSLSEKWHDINDFAPIPLTEEILLKCGFEFNENRKSWSVEFETLWENNITTNKVFYIKYDVDYGFWWCGLEDHSLDSIALCRIDYIHALQNIFHSITGQELNINL